MLNKDEIGIKVLNNGNLEIHTTLFDESYSGGENTIRVKIEITAQGIEIHPEGHNCAEGEFAPILCEYHDKTFRVLGWEDINDFDATTTMEFNGARETERKEISAPQNENEASSK